MLGWQSLRRSRGLVCGPPVRLTCPLPPPQAAGLLWRPGPADTSSHALSLAFPHAQGHPVPVTPRVWVLRFCRPCRVTQVRGMPPSLSRPGSSAGHTSLPRATARGSRGRHPCPALAHSCRHGPGVPAAQEGWGHIEKPNTQAGRSTCSFVFFFFSLFFSLLSRILIKCAHRRCRHFTGFTGAPAQGARSTLLGRVAFTPVSPEGLHLPN